MPRDVVRYLTVDPGLGGTGYAVWAGSPQRWRSLEPPLATGVISLARKATPNWLPTTERIANEFISVLNENWIDKCWIEYPGLHLNPIGYASAIKGDIFKLMFLVGRLAQCCVSMSDYCEFVPLPVNDWKGTLTKEAVANRVASRLECTPDAYPNHTMDAVGMGLYLKGYMNSSGAILKR